MTATTIILLPLSPTTADRSVHWWRIEGGALTETGTGDEWLTPGFLDGRLVALAPAASVRCVFAEAAGTADRQALGIARSAALVGGLADAATLHAVSAFAEPLDEDGKRTTVTAVVANSAMLEWIDWLDGLRADPIAIVPTSLLVPRAPDWRSASVGSDHLLVKNDLVMPDEPALRSALGAGTDVPEVAAELIGERIAALADSVPLNLRSGRFARRRIFALDRARLRELALLAAAIPLLGLLMALITIARLNSDSRALEQQTAALVSEAVGREIAVEGAAAALTARMTEQVGSTGSPFSSLSALYQQLQLVPAVGTEAVAWSGDGTLSATLAAPRADDLNRVLIGIQAAGYRITAVPRQASDGRAMTDVTIRAAP